MRSRILTAALAASLLASAGCTGGEGARADAGAKVLRLAMTEEPPQLDSTRATDSVSIFVLGHVMEGLTRYGPEGDIVPGVAERWELGERRAVFHLRADARWEDGRPVTARDFVFAWRTAVDPKTASEYAFILYPVKNAEAVNGGRLPPSALGVRAPDDRTLEVELERPTGYFLGLTAFATYLPVREDFYRARPGRYAADAGDLLSNGPFRLTRWVHAASLTLERNPRYWDAAAVQLDRIEVPYFTSDPATRYNLFKDGKIDLTGLDKDLLGRAQADRFRMRSFTAGSIFYAEYNHRPDRPTSNLHLRKALRLVFDPVEYVSKVIGIPGTRPLYALIPSWVPGVERPFRKEHPVPPVRPDLDAARRELELARRELGGRIPPLVWLTQDDPFTAREAEYFQYLLSSRLGLALKIDKQTFKQRLAKMSAGDFDVVASGWGPDYADAMTFADLFASWNENNHGKWHDDRYDALIREAQATAEPRVRIEAMAEAERILLDAAALLPKSEAGSIYLVSPRLSGVVRHVVGPDPDYTRARLLD
ncbi:MAG TPA: peptide ABC transporter substrate-binding protein [Anaeromyxobacteraceae bacterium]|nr:peptide ABC transporter substrate-binding protein [Anaeromyxobacteraceae bacterium]